MSKDSLIVIAPWESEHVEQGDESVPPSVTRPIYRIHVLNACVSIGLTYVKVLEKGISYGTMPCHGVGTSSLTGKEFVIKIHGEKCFGSSLLNR